jgi:hypothetical protein
LSDSLWQCIPRLLTGVAESAKNLENIEKIFIIYKKDKPDAIV